MKRLIIIISLLSFEFFTAVTAFPCTTFVLKRNGQIYFARNLDWGCEDGLIIINPRGVQKTSLVMQGHSPAKWTSKYGSVTFNQFGQKRPFGGMNETGLVVEQMMLLESQYPA